MKNIGLLVNPVAGMGGKVGLKGTDGPEVLIEARKRGAEPESPKKSRLALDKLLALKDSLHFFVASGDMGENQVKELGFAYTLLHSYEGDPKPEDSYALLEKFKEENLDLILFSGGDGTARDVTKYIGTDIPVIGIPAGVKIHSGVYAKTPEHAGELAALYMKNPQLHLKEEEIIDIEENAFRRDEIVTAVYGYMKVPFDDSHLQNRKSVTPQSDEGAQESAALQVIDDMEDDVLYIIGSGSTPYGILKELGIEGTKLGVDIIRNKELIARDVYDQQIIDYIKDEPDVRLVVTPMGSQGYLFGRGNQQLSAAVLKLIKKENITIMCTPGKMNSFQGRPLITYTGDPDVDKALAGYYKVITGYGNARMYKLEPSYQG